MNPSSEVHRLLPNEGCTVRGIPVRRLGLLWFEIDADYAPGLLTVDDAERVLDEMASLAPSVSPSVSGFVAAVEEVAQALLSGATLTARATFSITTCTVGPVLGGGWAYDDSDDAQLIPTEAWPYVGENGFSETRYIRDTTPFGVALAFVRAVGVTPAVDALPGKVVPWCCVEAAEAPQQEPVVITATDAHEPAADAPACQEGAAPGIHEATPPATDPVKVVWSAATAQHGDAVHVVVGSRMEIGRWVREPGQALCKPRGLRLKSTTGSPSCKGCIGEAEKRNIAL